MLTHMSSLSQPAAYPTNKWRKTESSSYCEQLVNWKWWKPENSPASTEAFVGTWTNMDTEWTNEKIEAEIYSTKFLNVWKIVSIVARRLFPLIIVPLNVSKPILVSFYKLRLSCTFIPSCISKYLFRPRFLRYHKTARISFPSFSTKCGLFSLII